MKNENPWKKRGESLRRQSLAMAIPTLFVGGPLGCGALGYWIGSKFDYPSSGFMVGLILGLVVAIRETVRILRILSKDT